MISLPQINLVKKYSTFILSAILFFGLLFVETEKAFSQIDPPGNGSDTARNASYVKGITDGRTRSLVADALGLASVIVGWRAMVRSNKTSTSEKRRTPAVVALVLGLLAIVLSVFHLTTSAGAVFGSGSGKAGAIIALLFGFIGSVLGSLVLKKRVS
jgi:hypothetical protein